MSFSLSLKGNLRTCTKIFKVSFFKQQRIILRTTPRKLVDKDIYHTIVFNHVLFCCFFFPRKKLSSIYLLIFKISDYQLFPGLLILNEWERPSFVHIFFFTRVDSHDWYEHLFPDGYSGVSPPFINSPF